MGNSSSRGKVPEGDSYVGDTHDGWNHGQGVYKWSNGNVYTGAFVRDRPCGQGTLEFNDNNEFGALKYTGEFNDGLPCGEGEIQFRKDQVYRGSVKAGMPDGEGRMEYSCGDLYVGEWISGKRDGKGKFTDFSSGECSSGYWKDDMLHGDVKQVFKDDYMGRIKFKGKFVKGKRCGMGTMEMLKGSYYKGDWKNNRYWGTGELKYENGNIYRGEFSKGQRKKGEMVYSRGGVYTGQFKNERRHGKGKFVYPSGDVYDGQWKRGVWWGKGTLSFNDGEIYSGTFKEGKWGIGTGTYNFNDGSVYEGEWTSGIKHGKGKFRLPNGNIYEGEWKEDQMHGQGKFIYAVDESGEQLKETESFEGRWCDGEVVTELNLRLAALKLGEMRVRSAKATSEKEIESLKNMNFEGLCRVCCDNPVDTIFLECCHMVCCHHCGFDQIGCPKCGQRVVKCSRTYMT